MREWACETLLATFRVRRKRAWISLGCVLVATLAGATTTWWLGSQRYRDPVPEILERTGDDLRAKANWLATVVEHPDIHPELRAARRSTLEGLLEYLTARDAQLSRVRAVRSGEELPADGFGELERWLEELASAGADVATDRACIAGWERQSREQVAEWEAQRERDRATLRARQGRVDTVLAALKIRQGELRSRCLDAAAAVGAAFRQHCDPSRGELADRNSFHDLLCSELPLPAVCELAVVPELRAELDGAFLDLAALAEGLVAAAEDPLEGRHAWGPSRRLALLERLLPRIPERLRGGFEAERELLERLIRPRADAGDAIDERRFAGLMVTPRDLDSLRDAKLRTAAVTRAEAVRESLEAVPAELDPWSFLDHVSGLAHRELGAVGAEQWKRWIFLLDQAVEEGTQTADLAAYMRLILLGEIFTQESASGALRAIARAEASGVFHDLVERRPFCELGGLVDMLREILKGLNARLQERPDDWKRWRVLVEELMRTAMFADRQLSEACLAASEPINRGAAMGAVRAEVFRNHAKKAEVARLRTSWNERTRELPAGSTARTVRDAVFQMIFKQERGLATRLRREPITDLHRSGIALGTGGAESAEAARVPAAAPWDELPRPEVAVAPAEVEELLAAGVPEEVLRRWAHAAAGELAAGFTTGLKELHHELVGADGGDPLMIALTAPERSEIPLELGLFHMDSLERYSAFMLTCAIGFLALLAAVAMLLRRRPPRGLAMVAEGEGGNPLVVRGGAPLAACALRDADGSEVLLDWSQRGGRESSRLAHRLPGYELRYRLAGSRRGACVYTLVPDVPIVESVDDRGFVEGHQVLSVSGRHLSSRIGVFIDGEEVTRHRRQIPPEEVSLSRMELLLPAGSIADGRRLLMLRSPAGESEGVAVTIGRTQLLRSDLSAFYFAANGEQVVDMNLLLTNDRGDPPRIDLLGDGAGQDVGLEREDHVDRERGMRRIHASLHLPIGSHVVQLRTSTAALEREVRIFDARTQVLSAVVRDRSGNIQMQLLRLPVADSEKGGQPNNLEPEALQAYFLTSSPAVVRAAFAGGHLYLVGTDAVRRFLPGRQEEEPLVLPHREAVSDYEHLSFAERGERLYMALAREGGRGGKLVYWQLPGRGAARAVSEAVEVEWADDALVEVAHQGDSVYYIARGEVYDLDDPDRCWRSAGAMPGSGQTRALLRLISCSGELYVVDLQYRLRSLGAPALPELANLAGRGAFVDPQRILSVHHLDGGLELLALDASRRDRLLLLRLDAETQTFRKDRGRSFEFDGTVLGAAVHHA